MKCWFIYPVEVALLAFEVCTGYDDVVKISLKLEKILVSMDAVGVSNKILSCDLIFSFPFTYSLSWFWNNFIGWTYRWCGMPIPPKTLTEVNKNNKILGQTFGNLTWTAS